VLARAHDQGIDVVALREGVLARLADAVSPQPIVACLQGQPGSLDELSDGAGFVLVAHRIADPGNLGALMRIAEACGADAVVVTGSSADPFGPKALRGSAGSALRLAILEHDDGLEALARLRARGLVVVSTSPHEGEDFAHLTWPAKVALVLGNEAHGLDEELLRAGDVAVQIPMASGVESLNLSVAAGILAMSFRRGLRAPGEPPDTSTIDAMLPSDPS
jgi:TrmH family RNA methyltransferase